MNLSSVMSNVTPCPTAGDQVTHSVMAAITSGTSDIVCRIVQLCLNQQTQGEIMCVCVFMYGHKYLLWEKQTQTQCSPQYCRFILSLPYISTLFLPHLPHGTVDLYHLPYYSHPFINPPSPLLQHTSHSGLYQNPDSRVCEPCDAQCVEGCSAGTVRLRHHLTFTQYGWQWI